MRTLDQVIKYASAQVQRQTGKQAHKYKSAQTWLTKYSQVNKNTSTQVRTVDQVQRHRGKQAQMYTSAHTWLTTRPLIFRHHPHLTSHSAGLNIDSSWLPLGGSCRIQKFEGIKDCLIMTNMTKGRRGFSHVFYIS